MNITDYTKAHESMIAKCEVAKLKRGGPVYIPEALRPLVVSVKLAQGSFYANGGGVAFIRENQVRKVFPLVKTEWKDGDWLADWSAYQQIFDVAIVFEVNRAREDYPQCLGECLFHIFSSLEDAMATDLLTTQEKSAVSEYAGY